MNQENREAVLSATTSRFKKLVILFKDEVSGRQVYRYTLVCNKQEGRWGIRILSVRPILPTLSTFLYQQSLRSLAFLFSL